jgi:anaerobic magnesium-protoporphyrin IX monomethyl ester cyclase
MNQQQKIKILLIAPRFLMVENVNYNYIFPVGLGYISSVLKKNNYDVTCFNLNHHSGKITDILKKEFSKMKYDYVLTGTVTGAIGYRNIKEISEATREFSGSKIIIGGGIITSEPELIFDDVKPDYGVLGEGEETIIELLKSIENKKDLNEVKGIIFQKDGKTVITETREPIKDLDSLPFPDFDGFEYEKYLDNLYPNQDFCNNYFDYPRTYSILTSRSCAFNCTFCYHPIGRAYRERSIDNVMEELENAIKKYKINVINIYDDMLAFKKERLNKFIERIKDLIQKTPWEIKWFCQLSVITVDEEILKKMKEAGCGLISYGFESFSPEVLRSMKKPITPEQIDKAFKMTLRNDLGVQANFIFGDLKETKETAKTTLEYWKSNCMGQVSLGFIQPYPCSEIYKSCVERGIIKDKLDFIKNRTYGVEVINMTEKMSDDEIKELNRELQYLTSKYTYKSTPNSIKKMDNGRFIIEVKCPFCKKSIVYKNYHLQEGKLFFKSYIICRECNKRFYIVSKPLRLILRFPNSSFFLETLYKKYRRTFKI